MSTKILRSEPLTSNTQLEFLNTIFSSFVIDDYTNQTSGLVLIDIEPEISHTKWGLIKDIAKRASKTNIKICFAQHYEALGWHANSHTWQKIIDILDSQNFSLNRVCYISGDLRYSPTNTRFDEIHHIGVNLFEIVTGDRYKNKLTASATNKSKQFLCLNYLARTHRRATHYYLKQNNLLDSNYCSFQKSEYENVKLPEVIIPYDKPWPEGIMHQSKKWYDDTVFSFVTETSIDNNVLFLTEKIYKPIMYGHPFVVLGNPGTLEYLQSKGYQTFPELFDESYDTTQNSAERLNKIIEICNTVDVQNYTPSVLNKLKHNQELFFSRKNSLEELQKLGNFLSQMAEI